MAFMHVPIEIYDLLEKRLGRDQAMTVAKSIEESLSHIADRSREIAALRKIEVKEELRVELRNELATKEDLALFREELAKLEGRMEASFLRWRKPSSR
ncbi:hypothetical protein Hthe01_18600 [Hydrogenophilus thermoluteolus]|uniref:hypothetical protein n=1 Tax=Hydrogenophilus thermoluteolus TaxID=297 RepID=UPI0024A2762E|nr:hypothetical protein [Hydrogenophilus thermoluteolus]GLW61511.1 hypothetical protein Hthe01_18600 [Hydrogenophilus thermoluteolus]